MDRKEEKERIKDSVKIPYILESWYSVTLNGSRRGMCPLCNYEKDKRTFCVLEDGKFFYCHHCNEYGDVFTLVMELENLDFKAAFTRLANHTGIETELTPGQEKKLKQEQERSAALFRFAKYWNEKLTDEVKAYLKKRKIEIEYVNYHLIGFIPEKATYQGDKHDLHHLEQMGLLSNQKDVNRIWCNRLFIPFRKNGQIVYFTGHGLDKNVTPPQLFPKVEQMGNKPEVGTCKGDNVLIVEGAFDFLTADQEPGLKSVIAILGNSRVFDLPPHIKTVDLCFDWDKAGYRYIDKYGLHFASMGKTVRVVTRPNDLPQDKNDLNDYVQAGGKIEDLKKIDIAEWYIEKLKSKPFDQSLKHNVFRILISKGDMEQSHYIAMLHERIYKNQNVGKNDIKKEFRLFTNTQTRKETPEQFTDHETGIVYKKPRWVLMGDSNIVNANSMKAFSNALIFIDSYAIDEVTGGRYVNLVSYRNGDRISRMINHACISSRQEIVKLSEFGFPVHSENAPGVINFLDDFFYANEHTLKKVKASSQLGWSGGSFIFPDRTLNPDGSTEEIKYLHQEPGKDAFSKKGDLEAFVKMIKDFKDDFDNGNYQTVIFTIYTVLSSFLLEKLEVKNNPIIYFCTESSQGKTTILKLAASVYGKWNYYNSFDDTENALVRKAGLLKNFPMLINEGSTNIGKDTTKTIYKIAEGQTKAKAFSNSGMEVTPTRYFKNIVIANGEISILSGREPTGAAMRVIELNTVFGGIYPKAVEKIEKTIKKNYGLLIEPFLKEVMKTDLENFKPFVEYQGDEEKIEFLIRKRDLFQPIYIAGCIAEKVFNFGYDPQAVVDKIFFGIEQEVKNLGVVEKFIPFLRSFVEENRYYFVNVDNQNNELPHCKIYGYIKNNKDLAILPNVFDCELMQAYTTNGDGRLSKTIKAELKKRGLIEFTSGRNQKQIWINGRNIRVFYFKNFFSSQEVGSRENEENTIL